MIEPRISIITPSYNHAHFLEETICSVLDQGYKNLEYIVVDGGSTDNSSEIIRKYEKHLAWWVSEKDRGQSHAINKGFGKATGDIANWLCSDDFLKPGALRRVAEEFCIDADVDVIAGKTAVIHTEMPGIETVEGTLPSELADIPILNPVKQPSCFFRRSLLRIPPVREDLHFVMDVELWAYFLSIGARWRCIDDVLSVYRFSPINKTSVGGKRAWKERGIICQAYSNDWLWWLTDRLKWPILKLRLAHASGIFGAVLKRVDWRVSHLLKQKYGTRYDKMVETAQWLVRQEHGREKSSISSRR
jgi:glycosyltransferase involved in cell wall biosynthesis